MENNEQSGQSSSNFLIIMLLIIIILLLGLIGYVYYTKDINPKNKLVQLFISSNEDKQIVNSVSQAIDNKQTVNSVSQAMAQEQSLEEQTSKELSDLENKNTQKNNFLNKMAMNQKEKDEIIASGEELTQETTKNKFLNKMALNQRETDEMIEAGEELPQESKKNDFLKKMAMNQKDTDEMIVAGKEPQQENIKSDFLKKMALMQKENDENIASGKEVIQSQKKNEYLKKLALMQKENDEKLASTEDVAQKSEKHNFLKKMAMNQKDIDAMIISEKDEEIQLKTKKDKVKFKTYTCNSFAKSSISVPKLCEKELYQFLERYKDQAMRFEIIGLVDNGEFTIIQNLEDVYGPAEVKEVKKYVQLGLSRQRVIEVTWLVKEYLKNRGKIDTVNYTVFSNNKRGFVIRAYFNDI